MEHCSLGDGVPLWGLFSSANCAMPYMTQNKNHTFQQTKGIQLNNYHNFPCDIQKNTHKSTIRLQQVMVQTGCIYLTVCFCSPPSRSLSRSWSWEHIWEAIPLVPLGSRFGMAGRWANLGGVNFRIGWWFESRKQLSGFWWFWYVFWSQFWDNMRINYINISLRLV